MNVAARLLARHAAAALINQAPGEFTMADVVFELRELADDLEANIPASRPRLTLVPREERDRV